MEEEANKAEEYREQLNQRNSEIQILNGVIEQLKINILELESKNKKLEEENERLVQNSDNWVKQYNLTMDLIYRGVFNLMNVYTNRRLSPVGVEDASSFGSM
jgi:predicted RNase H-like nuclease (RuvC/YqgF family)